MQAGEESLDYPLGEYFEAAEARCLQRIEKVDPPKPTWREWDAHAAGNVPGVKG